MARKGSSAPLNKLKQMKKGDCPEEECQEPIFAIEENLPRTRKLI